MVGTEQNNSFLLCLHFLFPHTSLGEVVQIFSAKHILFFQQYRSVLFFIFLHLPCHEFIGNGLRQLRLLSIGSHTVLIQLEQAHASDEPRHFLLGSSTFSDAFLSHMSGALLAARVLKMPNTYITSLGTNLVFSLFISNDAHCRLVPLCRGSICGHSFLSSAHSLNVDSIAFLVDSQVCGQRNHSIFLKGPENT